MPLKPKAANIKRTGRLIAALLLLLMLSMVGWTVWFLYGVLYSPASTMDGSSMAAAKAETLNTEMLDKIEKDMSAKLSRPIPQPEDLRNPFLIPTEPPAEPAPTPASEPPAAEPPTAPTQPEPAAPPAQ